MDKRVTIRFRNYDGLLTKLAFVALLLSAFKGYAQRDYFFRDSTFYPVNANTTYIAGKRILYKQNTNSTILIKDFTVSGDTTYYIRDVDFVNEQKGYVLVGRMYIGGETYLYKTLNAGTTWAIDSSYFNASERKSINQVQLLNDSLFVLFDGYYTSSLIRSFDGGQTWTMWFESLIAHYFQLHKCDNGNWYLIGLPGDGFSSYSFPIPDSLWTKDSVYFMSGCHNSAPGCIRVFREGNQDRATDFIAKQVDTLTALCGIKTAVISTNQSRRGIQLFPNPASNFVTITNAIGDYYYIYDMLGNICVQGFAQHGSTIIDLSFLHTGCYTIVVGNQKSRLVKLPSR